MENVSASPETNIAPETSQQQPTESKKSPKCKNMMLEQQVAYLNPQCNTAEKIISYIDDRVHPDKIAAILHDKDQKDNGNLKAPHIHAMMTFRNARYINAVAKALDIESQYIKKWDNRASNGFLYLVHKTKKAQEENKHPYDPSEVTANFNYSDYVAKQAEIREAANENGLTPKDLLDLLFAGYISKAEVEKRMTGSQYGQYRRQIEDVYSKRLMIQAEKFRREMKEQGRKIRVIWLFGRAGTGKSRRAREYAENREQSYFVTGSSRDMFQGYAGEHTLILDELRPEVMNYADLLRILDPYGEQVMAPSRYSDKPLACDFIIITSPHDPFSFYCEAMKKARKDICEMRHTDAVDQLMRRLEVIILFTDTYCEALRFDSSKVTGELLEEYKKGNTEVAKDVYAPIPGTRTENKIKRNDTQMDEAEAMALYWSIQGVQPPADDTSEVHDNTQMLHDDSPETSNGIPAEQQDNR